MKKKYDESKAKIASQQQRISFLERENFHLKADNIYLTQKINEISDSYEKSFIEYSEKIENLNKMISGYEVAKESIEAIQAEYEKKVQALLADIRRE